jgi:hypothetical protein
MNCYGEAFVGIEPDAKTITVIVEDRSVFDNLPFPVTAETVSVVSRISDLNDGYMIIFQFWKQPAPPRYSPIDPMTAYQEGILE